MKYNVITIGSATRDVFLKSSQFMAHTDPTSETGQTECVPLGSKIEVSELIFATGGGATNGAVTFARQGLHTACMAIVGNDESGREIEAELVRENIATEYLQHHSDDHTAYSTILVDKSGERTILSYKGEGQHFMITPPVIDALDADWLYVSSVGGNIDLLSRLLDRATHNTIKVAWNPGIKELELGVEKLRPLLSQIHVLFMNLQEAARLAGHIGTSQELARSIKELTSALVIITDGSRGSVAFDGTTIYYAAVPSSPRVDATGAGDAFGSAFVVEYSQSADIGKALQLATANASSVVAQFGAKAGILQQGDVGQWPLVEVQILQ